MSVYRKKALAILHWCLIAAMLLTLVFIFTNSLKPKSESLEQSGAFSDFVATIFPPDTEFGAFVKEYIRKIAHFTEYGLLGIELAVYISIYASKKLKGALLSLPLSLSVAFFDESLQYISDRGPAVSDIWIDVGGFAFFGLIAYGVMALVFFAIRHFRSVRQKQTLEDENG